MFNDIKPTQDYVIVETEKHTTSNSAGGILLIHTNGGDNTLRSKVLAVGEGKTKDGVVITPMTVKSGDIILMGKEAGTKFKLEGKEYTIVREPEIIAIV